MIAMSKGLITSITESGFVRFQDISCKISLDARKPPVFQRSRNMGSKSWLTKRVDGWREGGGGAFVIVRERERERER